MDKPEDHARGDVKNLYCKYCADSQGNLLPRETVRQNMIQFFVKTTGKDEKIAGEEVDKIMTRMPAWSGETTQATTMMDDQTTQTPVSGPTPPAVTPTPPMTEPSPAPEAPSAPPMSEPVTPEAPSAPPVSDPTPPPAPTAGPGPVSPPPAEKPQV